MTRERLLQKIEGEGGAPAQLVLVSAPAGSGKTVLLSQWVNSQKGQRRPIYFVTAAADADLWESVANVVGIEADGNGSGFPSSMVGAVRTWARTLPAPATLIIDSYDLVATPEVNDQLAEILAANTELRLLVASRRRVRLEHRETLKTLQLGPADLNFTASEVAELAALVGLEETGGAAELLEDYGGWALATHAQLLMWNMPVEKRSALPPIASDFYRSLPDSVSKQALALVGTLGAVTLRTLATAFNATEEEARKILSDLEDRGLVLCAVEDTALSYRTWRGFLPFLAELGNYWWTRSELEQLGAAQALEVSKVDSSGSLETLIKFGRFADAEHVAQQNFSRILDGGDRSLRALRLLTPNQLDAHISLFLARNALECTRRGVPVEATQVLARRLLRAVDQAREDGRTLSSARAAIITVAMERMLGNWERAMSQAQELYRSLQDEGRRETEDISALTYTAMSLTAVLTGSFDFAKSSAEAGYRLATAQDNTSGQVRALALQALALVLQGDEKAAINQLARADHLSAGRNLASQEYPWADRKIAEILVASRSGNMEKGFAALARLTDEIERMEQWPLVVFAESLLVQRAEGASEALMKMLQRLGNRPEPRMVSPFWEEKLGIRLADLEVANGRYQKAEEVLEEIVPFSDAARAAEARLAIFTENYARGIEVARRLLDEPAPWPVRAEALLALALCSEQRGQYSVAKESLREVGKNLDVPGTKEALLTAPTELLISASNRAGENALAAAAAAVPPNLRIPLYPRLTRSELTVIRALAGPDSMVQVAKDLVISENTLKTHRRRIYQKLAASNREEAVATAWRLGLLE